MNERRGSGAAAIGLFVFLYIGCAPRSGVMGSHDVMPGVGAVGSNLTEQPARSASRAELPPDLGGPLPTSPSSQMEAAPPLAPASLPETERLQPCLVELEHRYLGEDDETWETRHVPVVELVRDWENRRLDTDWDTRAVAPIPLTRAQALSLLPGAEANEYRGHFWIAAETGESSFTYSFDSRGRTVEVDWDPIADSSVYTFRYGYECDERGDDEELPRWVESG